MLKSMTLLYVEDDDDIRQLFSQRLRRQVAELILAENGRQGLELFSRHRPDIVVSDVRMPVMDGLEMAHAIKEISAETPIILTTAHNEAKFLLKAIEIGIDHYLLKPINHAVFQEVLTKAASQIYYKRELERKNRELLELYESGREDLAVANDIMRHIMHMGDLEDRDLRYFQRAAGEFNGDVVAAARNEQTGDLFVLLADATGHGLQAAVFLLPISRIFYSMVAKGFSASAIVLELNRTLLAISASSRFVAAALVHISAHNRLIEVWNGGMPAVLLVGNDGSNIQVFPSKHLPLGIVGDDRFDSRTVARTYSGDCRLLLYSDGLAEAENAEGASFGAERVAEIASQAPADGGLDRLLEALSGHLGGTAPHDDISVVLIRCAAPQPDEPC